MIGRLTADSMRLLAFGFAFAFFSSFGQTYYIAVFGGEIREAFGLSNGQFGAAYSGATLASGFLMIRIGGLMDSVPLRRYAIAAVLGLAVANVALGFSTGIVGLVASFFLLRLFGQGMMSHASLTAMARSFDRVRGRAIAFASLGLPVGQAVFPALGVLMLDLHGWRSAWYLGAVICVSVLLPFSIAVLRSGLGDPLADVRQAPLAIGRFLGRREIALAMPALMAPAFVGTAIFFHQVMIAEAKGWTAADFAVGFVVFSACSVLAMPVAGILVDRYTARRVARYFLLPSVLGCFALAATDEVWALHAYMALSAVTFGAMATVAGSLFAEVYGAGQIGAIRAVVTAAGVVASALSPVTIGLAYDAGIALDALLAALGVLTFAAAVLLRLSALTDPRFVPA